MASEHMAGSGLSDHFEGQPDHLPDDERAWWCSRCGAVFSRHHAETEYKFCNNCESRDAVLTQCKPVGPGAAQFDSLGDSDE